MSTYCPLSRSNANETWEALTAQHLGHSTEPQYDLQARFYEYQYEPGQEMKAQVEKVKNLTDFLADAGVPLTERQIVTNIFCTLPQAYHMLVMGTCPSRRSKLLLLLHQTYSKKSDHLQIG